jgi:hypothetical protein
MTSLRSSLVISPQSITTAVTPGWVAMRVSTSFLIWARSGQPPIVSLMPMVTTPSGLTDAGADLGPDVEETHLPHALEVWPDGVRVEAEAVGHVARGQRRRRAGQLQVDRVPRVVPQGLEQVESGDLGHDPSLHGPAR